MSEINPATPPVTVPVTTYVSKPEPPVPAAQVTLEATKAALVAEAKPEPVARVVIVKGPVYDGSPHPSSDLRKAFPLGKVDAYQSRRSDGTAFYDIRSGQNAFILDGKAFFAGETVKETGNGAGL